MRLKLSLILAVLLCLLQTNNAGAYSSRKQDVLVFVQNNTSVTFTVRLFNHSTGWYFFNAGPGGTNIGPVPEGTYDAVINPNGGTSQYSFTGFCSYSGNGYTVSWYNFPLPGSFSCSNQINISYW